MMILRQTKFDVETDKMLTKYLQVNSLAAPEEQLKAVHLHLNAFIEAFDGAFTREWALSVLKP